MFCLVTAVTVALCVSGCGGNNGTGLPGAVDAPDSPGSDSATGTIEVFAAASLADSFSDIEEAFEKLHPDADVRLNLAGSSALREQLREGAPADVFASASVAIFDEVASLDLVLGPTRVFARNRLRIAVPAGNPGGVEGIGDFDRDELALGLCSEGVPCGDLARQALEQNGVNANIDTNEPDVRALLTKIAADELDAGIVYATDVIAAGDEVTGIDIVGHSGSESAGEDAGGPATLEAIYPIGVIDEGPAAGGVRSLGDDVAQRILVDAGFVAA